MGWFKSIFTNDNDGISSKRVFGSIGWLVTLGVGVYCAIMNTQTPTIFTDIVFASAALLGIDSVTKIWSAKSTGSSSSES